MKIDQVDPEVLWLKEIIKKFMQEKHIRVC